LETDALETFARDQFLLTYEIPVPERAALPYAEYPVLLVGTNHAYPALLGFPLTEGAFFSQAAWKGRQRHAVLNETAAVAIFGSTRIVGERLRIRGETWLVTGLIRDGDEEECRIYVPSSIRGGPVRSLLALMDPAGDITEAYARDALAGLGVRDEGFVFFNLEAQARLFGERAEAAGLLLLALILLGLLPRAWKGLRDAGGEIQGGRARLRDLPFWGGKILGWALAFLVCGGLALTLLRQALTLGLPWGDLPSPADLDPAVFPLKTASLRAFALLDRILFAGFLGAAGVLLIFRSGIIMKYAIKKIDRSRPVHGADGVSFRPDRRGAGPHP
jgi:hypothetical protein